MLGADFDLVGWPTCGEIDILEYRGQEPKKVLGTIHGPGYSGGGSIGGSFRLADGRTLDEDFHVYAVEWSENRITWLFDDERYFTVSRDDLFQNPWVFDNPFFMLLNVAVGGNFLGPPDATTEFPQTMLIDYVRVYSSEF
jgi:beta-glucanase (GH16 family)